MSKQNKQPYGTVLIKANQILLYLAECQEPQRLYQIVEHTNLTNSTASKILNTLEIIGYVQRNPNNQEFSLGPTLTRFAQRSIEQMDIKEVSRTHLQQLQEATMETIHLGIMDHNRVVYIEKLESKNPVNLSSQIGKSIPLYCSAMGKALLADLPDEKFEEYLQKNELLPKTAQTITSKTDLKKEIKRIRNLGYAFDDAEHEEDVFCVGASITVNGRNFGAFSVSVPKYRLTTQLLTKIIDEVQTCKQNIIADLS